MKILHVNTIDTGGAAIAAIRLHYLLLENGIDSKILFLKRNGKVQIKESYYFMDTFTTPFFFGLTEKLNTIFNRRFTFFKPDIYFNGPDSLFNMAGHALFSWADVVHLHWVVKFLDWKKVFSNKSKKFVWTIHDMNPLTGGEHYKTGYNNEFSFIEKRNIEKKKKLIQGAKLTVIAPSKWLTGIAKESEVFKNTHVKTIRNPVDPKIFNIKRKLELRKAYNLPIGKKIILFVAEDPGDERKGYGKLIEAIEQIPDRENYHLTVIGKKTAIPESLNFTFFGVITGEYILSDLYNTADLFVIPSLEDNLPNTVSEALLCGTPVAGFHTGGIPEMVKNGFNGYLADGRNDLSTAIIAGTNQEFDKETIREGVLNELNTDKLFKEFMAVYNFE